MPALKDRGMWMFCLPAQVDGRHGIDLVVGGTGQGAAVGWLESPANPRDLSAWQWHPLAQVGWVMSLRSLDVDGDGDLDVVLSDRKGPRRGCRWLENPGPGEAQKKPWRDHAIGAAGEEVMFLDTLDADGDGLTDLLVPTHDGKLFLLRRKSKAPPAWESRRLAFPPQAGHGKAVRVGDLDRDGLPDFVLTCESSAGRHGALWVGPARGFADPPRFVRSLEGPAGPRGYKPDRIELVDLDGDGDLDVMTTEERSGLGVIWYENPAR
jgi:hypothetical protein